MAMALAAMFGIQSLGMRGDMVVDAHGKIKRREVGGRGRDRPHRLGWRHFRVNMAKDHPRQPKTNEDFLRSARADAKRQRKAAFLNHQWNGARA